MQAKTNSEFAETYLTYVEAKKDPLRWCERCWLLKSVCVCSDFDALGPAPSLEGHQVVLYMHYKEFKRASNTGNLACPLLGSERFLFGIEAQEQRFLENIRDPSFAPCVLYPTDTAVDLHEWKASLLSTLPVKLIVCDGTWTQAKRIAKVIPQDIPRVKLTPTSISQYKSRKQSSSTRVSSIEALALALQVIVGESLQDYLTRVFMIKDRGVAAQKKQDYDSLPTKSIS